MRVEPLRPDHLKRLKVQPAQREWIEGEFDPAILTRGDSVAYAGMVGDQPVAAVGVIDNGGGRGAAWALLSTEAGPVMAALHRAVLRGMGQTRFRRLEMVTAANFQPAGRWAEMLGFTLEGTMRAYCYDGSDALLWGRVLG